ncbi:MAG: polysaccharide deacetylase family protein [Pseudonocardiaceae bacterium]
MSAPMSVPAPVPVPTSEPPVVANLPADVIAHGSRERALVALTFDADMSPAMLQRLRDGTVRSWYDVRIIAELRRTQTPATIFATGLWATEYAEELREISADPLFEIENHSLTHAAFDGPCYTLDVLTSPDDKLHEVVDTAQILEEVTGRAPHFFRFPGGCYSPADVALVQEAGELPVGWDVVSGDPFQQDPAVIVRKVLDNVRPGSIVVLHLNGAPNAPATAAALREIIPGLHARGLQPVTLEQLLTSG